METVCLSTMYLLPAFVVLIGREIVCQRRWRRLATEDAGVEVTGLQPQRSLKARVNHQKNIHHRKLWRPMQVNGAYNRIEMSRVINNDHHIHYSIFYVTPTIRLFDDRCPSLHWILFIYFFLFFSAYSWLTCPVLTVKKSSHAICLLLRTVKLLNIVYYYVHLSSSRAQIICWKEAAFSDYAWFSWYTKHPCLAPPFPYKPYCLSPDLALSFPWWAICTYPIWAWQKITWTLT